jgi:hypothetical protein
LRRFTPLAGGRGRGWAFRSLRGGCVCGCGCAGATPEPSRVLRQAQDEPGEGHYGALSYKAFTPARQVRFLDWLAASGNVRSACARVGISAQAAYCARRRGGRFAAGWAAALVCARDHAEAVLADRALNGVEEAVFYHGEEVARRRRFDGRLLLAHLARLDRRCDAPGGAVHAHRFDEILAALAGVEPDPAMLDAAERFDDGAERIEGLGASRDAWLAARGQDARRAAELAMLQGDDWDEVGIDPVLLAAADARAAAAAQWDAQRAHACAAVDALCARVEGAEAGAPDPPLEIKGWPEGAATGGSRNFSGTVSTVSTLPPGTGTKHAFRKRPAGVNGAGTLRGHSRVPRIRSKERCMKKFPILAPVLFGATLLAIPAHAETVVFTATLSGAEEPGGGDARGSGSFRATVETSTGDVCYTLMTKDLAPAVAAHVHEGAAGATGGPVITVEVTGDDEYCLAAQAELLQAMAANPGNYYVNVHTRDFPAGAIRGQLAGPAGAAAPAPAAVPEAAPAVEAVPAPAPAAPPAG